MKANLKWGTAITIPYMDVESGEPMGVKAFGTCSYEVTDEALFGAAEGSEEADKKIRQDMQGFFADYFTRIISQKPYDQWVAYSAEFAEHARTQSLKNLCGYRITQVTVIMQKEELDEYYKQRTKEVREVEEQISKAEMASKEEQISKAETVSVPVSQNDSNQPSAVETPEDNVGMGKKIGMVVLIIIILILGHFMK